MPAEPVSDADLVGRSLRRDAVAFGSLVERHQRLVFGVALARCGDPALAEDVAQDAFVTAWRDLDRLRDADRVGSWVAGIARNLASNAARDRARRRAGIVALVVAAGATWFMTRGRDRHTSAAANAATAAPDTTATRASPVATSTEPPGPPPRVRRLRDVAERAALVEQIRLARQQRVAGDPHTSAAQTTAAASEPAPALPEPVVDKAYIRRAVRELIPLLADCYQQGLERDPKLAGTVVVDFTIEGEPGVGGVIGHSAIDPAETTLADAAARECIQETMYALEIDPPADGGVVSVRYPFEFNR